MAKLDPDNAKSAKSVMEENTRKRKRGKDEDENFSKVEGLESVDLIQDSEMEGMRAKKHKKDGKKAKESEDMRLKQHESGDDNGNERDPSVTKRTKSKTKQEKKKLEKAKHESKVLERAAKTVQEASQATLEKEPTTGGLGEVDDNPRTGDLDSTDTRGILGEPDIQSLVSTVTPSPNPQSPIFDDLPINSGSSTISSIAPPSSAEVSKLGKSPAEVATPKPSQEELKVRLAQRIEFLRAARKADGPDGKPARNRQELIEARRKKEEQRRAKKRELRQKEREEEKEKRNMLVARGSPLLFPSASISKVPRPSSPQNNFSFNRIAFPDGQNASAELSTILSAPKPKGPQDPLTALQAAQKKQSRLDALDPSTRTEIAEKDLWLNARKHAHGERVRDDASLLKKTLKRKEQAKKKSEREWGERIEGVEKGKAMRVKRRDENIRKRKEEKGGRNGVKKPGKPKPKGRPGFEGSLKAKAITSGKRARK